MDQHKQYSLKEILTIWFWTSVPGAVLYWAGLPLLEKIVPIPTGYLVMMVFGLSLTWIFIYSLILVKKEEGNLRWETTCKSHGHFRDSSYLTPCFSRTLQRGSDRPWCQL